jgi:signal transduction histidine kinase/ActR/RegA family two-component response regulator
MKIEDRATADVWHRLNVDVLSTTSIVTMVVAFPTMMVYLIKGPGAGISNAAWITRISVCIGLVTLGATCLGLTRRGRHELATAAFSTTFFAMLLVTPIVLQLGVRAAAVPLLVVSIFTAGMLIGPWAAAIWTTASLVSVVLLYWAENTGLLVGPTDETAPRPLLVTLTYSALFITVGLLTYRFSASFRRAIQTLNTSHQRLEATIVIQRDTEVRLRRASEEAAAANAAKSRFLATMSHEIRTPMNGILGMAQLLMTPNISENDRHEYSETILSSGQVLLTVLNDILDVSKIEAGKLELSHVELDPQAVLTSTVNLFGAIARSKGLTLSGQWSGSPGARYLSDPVRVQQMLSNLVSNALKFTSIGGVVIETSEFSSGESGTFVRFTVHDTGAGISPEKLNLLFKPFTQVDASDTRQHGGTGLGLSIVQSLARLLGGEAGVESTPGLGSSFWFTIRAHAYQRQPAPNVAAPSPQLELRNEVVPASAPRRILLVEDNPVNRRVAEAMLHKLHCQVVSVENGDEALLWLGRNEVPDLVLMDCQMPVMDGFEATLRIRQWERDCERSRLPIVALSASTMSEERSHCLEVGMDDFLPKPVELHRLALLLDKWARPATSASAPP